MKQTFQNMLDRFIVESPVQKKVFFYCLVQKSIGTKYKPVLYLYAALSRVGSIILLPPLTKSHFSVTALEDDVIQFRYES